MDEERERGTGGGAGIRGDARRSIARRPFREEHGGDLREERGGGGARFGAGQRRGTGDARGSSALTSSLILMSTSRKSSRCDTSTSGSIPAHTRGRPSTVAQSLKLQPSFHTGAVPSKIFRRDTVDPHHTVDRTFSRPSDVASRNLRWIARASTRVRSIRETEASVTATRSRLRGPPYRIRFWHPQSPTTRLDPTHHPHTRTNVAASTPR